MSDPTGEDIPEWIVAEVRYWGDIFELAGWEVNITLERVVNKHPDCTGWCERNTSYNQVTLHFRDDIEDTPKWRKIILHEVLHIVMARVDAYVQDAMQPELAASSQRFAGVVYTQHTESFVQMLTTAYWRFYNEQLRRDHS